MFGAAGIVTVGTASSGSLNPVDAPLISLPTPPLVSLPVSPVATPVCVLGICLPTPTPNLPSLPVVSVPTPLPAPSVCPPVCPSGVVGNPTPSANSAGGAGGGSSGGGTGGVQPGVSNPSLSGVSPDPAAGPPNVGGGGLTLAQPGPIAYLTPLAGISFGQAPYLWPLFLVLDVIAAAAVMVAVRRSRSAAGAN